VLVPTAERDPAIALAIFGRSFRGVRAVMYNSPKSGDDPGRGRQRRGARRRRRGRLGVPRAPTRRVSGSKFEIDRPFAIYIGRIDENKGCKELFDYYPALRRAFPRGLDLVLVGSAKMPIRSIRASTTSASSATRTSSTRSPPRPADHAVVLREPLDGRARSLGARPAGARQRPLRRPQGQCIRSNAGLYYERYEEFAETLYSLESNGPLHARSGRTGASTSAPLRLAGDRAKYMDMFERCRRTARHAARASSRCPGGWRAAQEDLRPAARFWRGSVRTGREPPGAPSRR
jgi:hypothetical protein